MSYKPQSMFSLIESMNRDVFLPHIQRPFVWNEDQMKRLFDSLMRNFPIQTFLFWRTKDGIKTRKFMGELDWDANLHDLYDPSKSAEGVEKIFVLDGQQRLQTLYCLFNGMMKNGSNTSEAYFDVTSGAVEDETGMLYSLDFSPTTKGLPWYRLRDLVGKDNQKNAEEIADSLNGELDDILSDDGDKRKVREKTVRRTVSQLTSLLREDKYFWIETLDGISMSFPYSKVLNIFVRVNSGGTKLDAADLMFAALKEGWADIEENLEEIVEMLNAGKGLAFDKGFALKCLAVAIGKGAELTPTKFTGQTGEATLKDLKDKWEQAEQAFYELRDFIVNELKIYSDKVVRSYNAFVPLYDYLFNNPKPGPENRVLMKAYHYKSQLFNWYAAQTDGVINILHNNYVGKTVKDFPLADICTHFKTRKAEVDLTPTNFLDIRLRFIILNLLYVEQFGTSPFNVRFKGNEPHIDHIYPKSSLAGLGLPTVEINHIGNYRFIGATDNLRKKAESPSSYFQRLKNSGIPIEKHLLCKPESQDPSKLIFDGPTYMDFRDRRASEIFNIAKTIVNPP